MANLFESTNEHAIGAGELFVDTFSMISSPILPNDSSLIAISFSKHSFFNNPTSVDVTVVVAVAIVVVVVVPIGLVVVIAAIELAVADVVEPLLFLPFLLLELS